MPKIAVYLNEQQYEALETICRAEYRLPKAQALMMIVSEIQRRGLLADSSGQDAKRPVSAPVAELK